MYRIDAEHQGIPIHIEYDDLVYQPGSYTAALADLMEVRPGDRVVDVGCGTGYLGIMAALLGAGDVIAIDPDPQAIRWTLHNARLNGVSRLTVYQAAELDPVEDLEVDLIITLPPQMPFPVNFNYQRYGGTDGTDVILKIIDQAGRVLAADGRMFLLHAALADPRKVRRKLAASGFDWQVVKSVERELNPVEFDELAKGLREYILELHAEGRADLFERNGRWYYPIWFYRAMPDKTLQTP